MKLHKAILTYLLVFALLSTQVSSARTLTPPHTTTSSGTQSIAFASSAAHVPKVTPSYTNWGLVAVAEAKKKYPTASVVDYKRFPRIVLSPTTAQDTFKLWMKDGDHELGLYVYVVFDIASENLRSITFKETSQ